MKREVLLTKDGSHTIYVPELGEHYHSIHGAIQESQIIYINAGLKFTEKKHLRILEYGMGTGLNVLLTFKEASASERIIEYHAIEKYPLTEEEIRSLNYRERIKLDDPHLFEKIHQNIWSSEISLSKDFGLIKYKTDFRKVSLKGSYDIVYFDAFAPEIQAELWTSSIFNKIAEITSSGSVLTSYTSKGEIRRRLQNAGFMVEKLPGPPGKREFIRAIRI
jgi:tRNA U34 5-methylaminomethyl-2-thiouridine-forming methyltransferase MnmC